MGCFCQFWNPLVLVESSACTASQKEAGNRSRDRALQSGSSFLMSINFPRPRVLGALRDETIFLPLEIWVEGEATSEPERGAGRESELQGGQVFS